ncbi:hypothetical protein ES703_98900 [subsurface metagenome]
MIIVVQPSFFIKILTGKPEVIHHAGFGIHTCLTKWLIRCLPDNGASIVGHNLRGAQAVIEVIIHGTTGHIHLGYTDFPHIQILSRHGAIGLALSSQFSVEIIMKNCCDITDYFYHPLP